MPEKLAIANETEFADIVTAIMTKYGRSGSGRASALRLVGAYVMFSTEGASGFRRRGFNRMSLQLYRDKLREAGVDVD